jgi:hypothetical protein
VRGSKAEADSETSDPSVRGVRLADLIENLRLKSSGMAQPASWQKEQLAQGVWEHHDFKYVPDAIRNTGTQCSGSQSSWPQLYGSLNRCFKTSYPYSNLKT